MVIDFSSFYNLPRQLDRFFDEAWRPSMISQRRNAYPPVNISEDKAAIYVYSEIPGVDIKDVEITLSDGSLVIKGNRKHGTGSYYRQERPTGLFQRVVNLNVPIAADKVEARMKNGVLEVVIPKADEAIPKKISIKAE
ncbi:Hsp20/alpha crystallin family protein [Desulfonatronovibrio hydrogenovorans]|uniref:Hsp20/alpha crystallin family protein n=1 Tax=Desulfonatronovibrio hydrogenovorans TaxID=53245 RepID=UPI00048A50FB|nr:Hsp20/alpha crystallin family protein [Desulfonatronovibrio hydrogenovorans]